MSSIKKSMLRRDELFQSMEVPLKSEAISNLTNPLGDIILSKMSPKAKHMMAIGETLINPRLIETQAILHTHIIDIGTEIEGRMYREIALLIEETKNETKKMAQFTCNKMITYYLEIEREESLNKLRQQEISLKQECVEERKKLISEHGNQMKILIETLTADCFKIRKCIEIFIANMNIKFQGLQYRHRMLYDRLRKCQELLDKSLKKIDSCDNVSLLQKWKAKFDNSLWHDCKVMLNEHIAELLRKICIEQQCADLTIDKRNMKTREFMNLLSIPDGTDNISNLQELLKSCTNVLFCKDNLEKLCRPKSRAPSERLLKTNYFGTTTNRSMYPTPTVKSLQPIFDVQLQPSIINNQVIIENPLNTNIDTYLKRPLILTAGLLTKPSDGNEISVQTQLEQDALEKCHCMIDNNPQWKELITDPPNMLQSTYTLTHPPTKPHCKNMHNEDINTLDMSNRIESTIKSLPTGASIAVAVKPILDELMLIWNNADSLNHKPFETGTTTSMLLSVVDSVESLSTTPYDHTNGIVSNTGLLEACDSNEILHSVMLLQKVKEKNKDRRDVFNIGPKVPKYVTLPEYNELPYTRITNIEKNLVGKNRTQDKIELNKITEQDWTEIIAFIQVRDQINVEN